VPADYSRIHRLLKIVTLIQSDSTWTADRLARECGVAVRTIYRDMKMLEGAGIPYFFDSDSGGYQVRRDFFMPPVQLTLDESLALIALGEHIGDREQIPLTKSAGRAIAKVRSQLPLQLREEIGKLEKHIAIRLTQAGPHYGIEDVYEEVRHAIARGRVLKCRYESIESNHRQHGRAEEFEFRPYALFFSQRAWYTVGQHGGHREVRCLKLNRFTAIEPTKERYQIPHDFTLDTHLGNAWRMIRGKKTYNVELWFDPEFAETISDTHWHATQEIDWQDDDSIVFCCKVDGLEEILWWILSMGPHCVVRKPKALADRVRSLAQEMVDAYAAEATEPAGRGEPERRLRKRAGG